MAVLTAVLSLAVLGVGGTMATLFSDMETSPGNQTWAGTVNLVLDIDGVPLPDGAPGTVVTLEGLVPPTVYTRILSYHNAGSLPGAAWLDLSDIVDDENGLIDPEEEAGDHTPGVGELSNHLYVLIWEDANGNGRPDSGERHVFEEYLSFINNTYGGTIRFQTDTIVPPGGTGYIGMRFNISPWLNNNLVQTDRVTLTLAGELVQLP